MANELKPCPFCGNEPSLNHMGTGSYTVSCSNGHHIYTEASKDKAIKAWNTRPAAPVDGLERYDISMFGNGAVEMGGGEYVLFSQAVAIIAAERSRAEVAVAAMVRNHKRAEKAEADNAALTARVKELGAENVALKSDVAGSASIIEHLKQRADANFDKVIEEGKRAESLETQLAAAKKALEFISGIGFVAAKDAPAHHDEAVKVARAALEGKP